MPSAVVHERTEQGSDASNQDRRGEGNNNGERNARLSERNLTTEELTRIVRRMDGEKEVISKMQYPSEDKITDAHTRTLFGQRVAGMSEKQISQLTKQLTTERKRIKAWAREKIRASILEKCIEKEMKMSNGKIVQRFSDIQQVLKEITGEHAKTTHKMIYESCYKHGEDRHQWPVDYEEQWMEEEGKVYDPETLYVDRHVAAVDENGRGCIARIMSVCHKNVMSNLRKPSKIVIRKKRTKEQQKKDGMKKRKKGAESMFIEMLDEDDYVTKEPCEDTVTTKASSSPGSTGTSKEQDSSSKAYMEDQPGSSESSTVLEGIPVEDYHDENSSTVPEGILVTEHEDAYVSELRDSSGKATNEAKMKKRDATLDGSMALWAKGMKTLGTVMRMHGRHDKEIMETHELRKELMEKEKSKRKKQRKQADKTNRKEKTQPSKKSRIKRRAEAILEEDDEESEEETWENTSELEDEEKNGKEDTSDEETEIIKILGHRRLRDAVYAVKIMYNTMREEEVTNIKLLVQDDWNLVYGYVDELVRDRRHRECMPMTREMLGQLVAQAKGKRNKSKIEKLENKVWSEEDNKKKKKEKTRNANNEKSKENNCNHNLHDMRKEENAKYCGNTYKLDGVRCAICERKMVESTRGMSKQQQHEVFRPTNDKPAYHCKDVDKCKMAYCGDCYVQKLLAMESSINRGGRRRDVIQE